MFTDAVEVVTATGKFPSSMEAEEFLEVLSEAGYDKHLAKPATVFYKDNEHTVVLKIKKYAHFVVKASLDGDGPLEKWQDNFSFDQQLY